MAERQLANQRIEFSRDVTMRLAEWPTSAEDRYSIGFDFKNDAARSSMAFVAHVDRDQLAYIYEQMGEFIESLPDGKDLTS